MPQITFINADGSSREVHVEPGSTVMQAAVDNGVDGIIAECGGACSCATCHVYVTKEWLNKLEPADDMEQGMLECAHDPRDNSRLSCQLEMTDELDGLVVEVPEEQY